MNRADQDAATSAAGSPIGDAAKTEEGLNAHLANAEQLARLGWWEWDVERDRLSVFGQFSRIFACREEDCPANLGGLLLRVHPADRQILVHLADGRTGAGGGVGSRYRILCGHGSERLVDQQSRVVRNDAGRPVRILAAVQDVTERARAATGAGALCLDELTALPNRRRLLDRLQFAVDLAEQHERTVGVLALDLDGLGRINDSLGHAMGDRLLREAGKRLMHLVRKSDLAARDVEPGNLVARLGGEFIVLLAEVRHGEDAARVARRVVARLSRSYRIGQHELFMTVSVGAAVYPVDATEPEALLRNAHLALRSTKMKGGNGFNLFTESMNDSVQRSLRLETDLRRALDRSEFVLHYQPTVAVSDGVISGAEALLRWRRSDGRLTGPDHFISACEESRLILPVGRWVLEEACLRLRRWSEAGLPKLRLAVNISPVQFADPGFVRMVSTILEESGVHPWLLDLELTESAVMENLAQSRQSLHALREMGLQVVLDDFGTGYSSLSVLKDLPLDALKIDRSFVREVPRNPKDVALVTAVIAMAQAMRLRVVVEGVENEAQRDFFATIGCDEFQGYLVGRAMPDEAFLELASGAGQRASAPP